MYHITLHHDCVEAEFRIEAYIETVKLVIFMSAASESSLEASELRGNGNFTIELLFVDMKFILTIIIIIGSSDSNYC